MLRTGQIGRLAPFLPDPPMNPVVVPLSAMTLTHLVGFMAFQAVPVVAPDAARSLGIDPAMVGFYTSLAYAGGMLSALSSGALIPRWGPIRLCQITLLVAAAGMALTASGSLVVAVLAALIVGLGHGPITPAAAQLLRATSPPGIISLVFSIKQAAVPLGLTIAGVMLPPIVLWAGWEAALLTVGALCFIGALLLQTIRPRYDAAADPRSPFTLGGVLQPLRIVWTLKPVRELTLVAMGLGTGMFCITTFLVVYLTESVGIGLVGAGLYLAATQVAGMVGRVLWGAVADYSGRPRLVLACLAWITAGGFVMLIQVSPDWPHWALLFLAVVVGGGGVGWPGVLLAQVARHAPEEQAGAAIAGLTTLFGLAMVFIPSGISVVVTITGSYAPGFALVAVTTGLSALQLMRKPPPA